MIEAGPRPRFPKKRFGQHFLRDQAIIERIVAAIAPRPGQRVVEIGPGTGALTLPLLRALGQLDVVEVDRDLAGDLSHRCQEFGTLRVHATDALKLRFCSLYAEGRTIRLVGNLPYNISTPLLFHVLGQAHCIEDMVFMLQREVADRLTARPGTGQYGRLSVMVQYRCAIERLCEVGPEAFYPPPRVHSCVLRLVPKLDLHEVFDEELLSRLVKRAFSLRRKTLRNALKGVVSATELRAAGIDPGLRPEALGADQFIRLANQLATASRD